LRNEVTFATRALCSCACLASARRLSRHRFCFSALVSAMGKLVEPYQEGMRGAFPYAKATEELSLWLTTIPGDRSHLARQSAALAVRRQQPASRLGPRDRPVTR